MTEVHYAFSLARFLEIESHFSSTFGFAKFFFAGKFSVSVFFSNE